MRMHLTTILCLSLLLAACGQGSSGPAYDEDEVFPNLGLTDAETPGDLAADLDRLQDVPIDPPPAVGKDYHPVFPEALPFDPDDGVWQTGKSPPSVADPRALKGGKIRLAYQAWPPTIRTEGPNSRLAFLSDLHAMVYETLLGLDAVDMQYVPNLASHWQIGDDKMTYRFRIDERARWPDDSEVTADDVVATVEHMTNPDRKDPLIQKYYEDMIEYARMIDKHTVEIKTREPRWRNFISISNGMQIYPAAYIRMDGATYIEEWNWKLPPGTGPYEIRPEDIKKPRSITLHRRKDWWQKDFPENRGAYNFDEIVWEIVRDQELMYQRALAGKIDLYLVGRAQRWVDELDREEVIRQGWMQKRKIYNKNPEGYGGFCFNMRTKPFDDVRTRLAFAHLFNREKLFEKILLYQYEYTKSYFPDQPYEREGAERIRFDPQRARALLAEAGWTKRDAEGYLVNDRGQRFPELTLEFAAPGFQRIFEVIKHDLRNEAGIEMVLKVIDSASLMKKVWDYKFQVVYFSWTASLFPEPIQQFHSKYADVPNSNNLNGFKNEEIDRLMEDYQTEFDPAKRKGMLQRIDEILFENHLYALGWHAPFFRIIYWDKFGYPPEYCNRTTRDLLNVMVYWWYDPERANKTAQNMPKGVRNHPDSAFGLNQSDAPEQRYWLTHDRPLPDDAEKESAR